MTHQPNPNHLPPETSRRQLEGRIAELSTEVEFLRGLVPAWVPCPDCTGFLCTIHLEHAEACPCPPVEEWSSNPYSVDF